MSLGLTKLDNILTRISILIEKSAIKPNNTKSLSEGIYNIITKFPIIGRFLESFKTYQINKLNFANPFKLPYNGIIKPKINIYPFKKISKFSNINIATIVENKVEFNY